MKKMFFIMALMLVFAGITTAQTGVKKRRPLPYEYGNVVMDRFSEKAGLAPAEFNHWLHRGIYTCRLCHMDIGFAMKANGTGVRATDNAKGYYCGTCHNGKMLYNKKPIFATCAIKYTQEEGKRCDKCHSLGKNVTKDFDFSVFTEKLPRERFGNGINWEKAEENGLLKLSDYIEGISIKRTGMKIQPDFVLNSKVEGMPAIVFSHKKHTVWNGCEVCHPDIFVGVKRGATKYSMVELFEGKFCGVCHTKVAFPMTDCQRCHTEPV